MAISLTRNGGKPGKVRRAEYQAAQIEKQAAQIEYLAVMTDCTEILDESEDVEVE